MYGSNEGKEASPNKTKLRRVLIMRTTNKEFKGQVQEHILNGLLDEVEIKSGYGIEVTEENLTSTQLQLVINEFTSWYCKYEQKRIPNRYEAFKDWFLGLPSCFNVEYEYYKINETLKAWFENCGTKYKEVPEDKEATLYYHLVTREFIALCKKYKLQF